MELIEKLQTIIIVTYLIILIIILLITFSFYNDYAELKKSEDKKNSSGMWNTGTFLMNPEVIMPIDDETENQNLKILINRHKKSLTVFWIWVFMIIPFIIILYYMS
jgi:1,4-dihydroxy-2-naphthoate octaprenyltransferase